MELKKAPPVVSEINVTPMVDVMLVVLIIFMVITPMLSKGVAVDMVKTHHPVKMQEADKEERKQADARVPIPQLTTLEAKVQGTLWQERLLTALASLFGIVSLALAMAGVYGALDYSVAARRQELGIRIAIGAQTIHIVKTVGSRMMLAVAGGVGVGLIAALVMLDKVAFIAFWSRAARSDSVLLNNGRHSELCGHCGAVTGSARNQDGSPSSAQNRVDFYWMGQFGHTAQIHS